MERKKLVEDYFSFSRKDRIGILVLLFLIVLIFFLPFFFPRHTVYPLSASDTAWVAAVRQLETRRPPGKYGYYYKPAEDENVNTYMYEKKETTPAGHPGKLFVFDPNTLDADGWKELGIREKTVHTINNYLQKGGHFYKVEDLQKVYGLRSEDYQRLLPYIRIAGKEPQPAMAASGEPSYQKSSSHFKIIDINTADTSAWIALPGIGSKLATRIVSFREKLGGFYSVKQVAEIYGLADSVFQKLKGYLKLENAVVRKININTATLEELKDHPYIRYTLANPIIAYRKEHGAFPHPEELKRIMAITEEVYQKIIPYVTVD